VTSTSMQVTVPQGVQPGQMFMVQAPNGQQVQVQVPQGVMPGMAIQVNLPAPVAAVTPMAIGVPMSMAAPASPQPSYAQVAAPPRSHVPPAKFDGLLLVLAIVVNLAVPIVWWAVLNRDFSITNESRWVTGFRSFAYGALGVPYAFLAVATAVLEIISAAACCPAQKRPSATGGGCSCCGQICLLTAAVTLRAILTLGSALFLIALHQDSRFVYFGWPIGVYYGLVALMVITLAYESFRLHQYGSAARTTTPLPR